MIKRFKLSEWRKLTPVDGGECGQDVTLKYRDGETRIYWQVFKDLDGKFWHVEYDEDDAADLGEKHEPLSTGRLVTLVEIHAWQEAGGDIPRSRANATPEDLGMKP